jgi:cytidylate kinase
MTITDPPVNLLIGIVGPCGAGKTTLADGLNHNGFRARAIAQEHSYVKDMWQRITRPDLLIFLQASCAVGGKRRQMEWTEAEWQEQQYRLMHARQHAVFYLDTDQLGISDVLDSVMEYLKNH